jgi:hypothetical protein
VTVNYDMITKRITVELDGRMVYSKLHYSPLPMKFHLDVGTSETHKVDVRAGWFTPIKVLGDGKPAQRML